MNKIIDLPISENELCRRFEAVFTSAANDVLRSLGYLDQTLPYAILPLREHMKVCGIAFTIKGCKDLTTDGEMERRAEMLDALSPDCVAVWDTSGDDKSAEWGEIMTMAAKKRGCRGAVIDGGVRDTEKVLAQDFPVFCRYRTSNGMLGRFRMTGFQIPVKIGDVNINPGDVIFGDIDGVIVIPRGAAYQTLIESEKIKANEEKIKKQVADGIPPSEVVRNGGYF